MEGSRPPLERVARLAARHGHRVGRCLIGLVDEPLRPVDAEDSIAQDFDERFAADMLDDQPEQVVVGVRVFHGADGTATCADEREDLVELPDTTPVRRELLLHGAVPRFDAWVFRIVANGCKDWLKNIRRTHLSYEDDDQPTQYANPDEDLDRTELRTDLDGALGQLPTSLREAFVMKHVEGRSYEEMADLLATTVGALKMRVHRAREALQALLEEKYA